MIEKVRLSVDKETEEVLQKMLHGLEDILEEEPPWAARLRKEVGEGVGEVRKMLEASRSENAETRRETTEDLARLRGDLAALQNVVNALEATVREQKQTLERLARPWWKKVFGR